MDGTAIVVCDGLFATANGKTAHGLVRGTERYRILARDRRAHGGPRRRRGARRRAPRHPGLRLDRRRPRRARREARLLRRRRRDLGRPRHARVCGPCSSRRSTPACRSSTGSTSSSSDDPGSGRGGRAQGRDDPRRAQDRPPHGAALLERRDPLGRRARASPCSAPTARSASARPRASCSRPAARPGSGPSSIFTGQTGWMQGAPFGFILDSMPNDFVSGELEHAIVSCWESARPELILLEGQSALRNPSGPCGSEFLLSGRAKGVILQHAPGADVLRGPRGARPADPAGRRRDRADPHARRAHARRDAERRGHVARGARAPSSSGSRGSSASRSSGPSRRASRRSFRSSGSSSRAEAQA